MTDPGPRAADPADDFAVVGPMLVRALAERGSVATFEGDHVATDDGAKLGLDSLTLACRRAARRDWPAVVARRADLVVASRGVRDVASSLTLDDARRGVHLRLQPIDAVPWPETTSYARLVGTDVLEVLVHKDGESLLLLTDEIVERIGLDALREHGLANLVASPMGRWTTRRVEGGAEVLELRGESGFTASRALVLPDLLRRTIGRGEEVPLPHGALVVVPDRHTIAVHVVGHPALIDGWLALQDVLLTAYPGAPYPLSPDTWWWVDNEVRQLTGLLAPGDPEVRETYEQFARLFEELTGTPVEVALDRAIALRSRCRLRSGSPARSLRSRGRR